VSFRTADAARLVVLALIWSASFVLLRVLSPVLGPLWVATGRLVIAGAALAAWLRFAAIDGGLRLHWRAYLVVGVVNCAAPFVLYAYAVLHLPASYLVILNATSPLWGVVLAARFLGERMRMATVAGLVAGLGGVALVTRAVPVEGDASFALAVGAGIAAALCYALAAVWLKRRGSTLVPVAIAAWSQLLGGAVLLPIALPSPVAGPLTVGIAADLLVLALVCSGIAYLLYYRLIRDIGPTRALTVTFLMPAFGMLWGTLLLDEHVTAGMVAGAALIIAGTASVLIPRRAKPRTATRATRAA
jgi:drug/metabolite transporter (DMT)-like permease